MTRCVALRITQCVTPTTDFGQYILFFEFSIPLLIGRFIYLFSDCQLNCTCRTWHGERSKVKQRTSFFFSFSGSWLKYKVHVDLQDKVHLDWVSCDQIVRAEFLLVISQLKSQRRYCNYSIYQIVLYLASFRGNRELYFKFLASKLR